MLQSCIGSKDSSALFAKHSTAGGNSSDKARRQLQTDSETAVEFLWRAAFCEGEESPASHLTPSPPTHRIEAKHKKRRKFKACQDPRLWKLVSHMLHKKSTHTQNLLLWTWFAHHLLSWITTLTSVTILAWISSTWCTEEGCKTGWQINTGIQKAM